MTMGFAVEENNDLLISSSLVVVPVEVEPPIRDPHLKVQRKLTLGNARKPHEVPEVARYRNP